MTNALAPSPVVDFLRGLLCVRENPFLWMVLRRDLRGRKIPLNAAVALTCLGLVTVLTLVGARWLFTTRFGSRISSFDAPGAVAAAIVTTLEFYFVMAWARKRRYGLAAARENEATADFLLIPRTPARLAGLTRTYPLIVAAAFSLLCFPFHLICAQGGGGLDYIAPVHLFMLAMSLIYSDQSPAAIADRKTAPAPKSRTPQARRRSAAFSVFWGMWWVNWGMRHAMGSSVGATLYLWLLLYPYLLPRFLSEPRPLWGLSVPPGWPALLMLAPSVVQAARASARALHSRPETIRVTPWSFSSVASVLGLTVILGFCWPYIEAGLPAVLMGATSPDPALSADGVFGLLMVLWATFLAGFGFSRGLGTTVSFGFLPSHHAFTEKLGRRGAAKWEALWTLEAAASVYVPIAAFCLAWLIGRTVPWPDIEWVLAAAGLCAAALGSFWGLGRLTLVGFELGKRTLIRWLWAGAFALALGGMALPAPFGRYLLSVSPLTAPLGCVPFVRGYFAGLLPAAFVDLPDPRVALPIQAAVALLGLYAVIRVRWARAEAAPDAEKARRATGPGMYEVYERPPLVRRLTANPVAIRLNSQSAGETRPEGLLFVSVAGALLCYAIWLYCLVRTGWGAAAAKTSLAAVFAEQPWILAGVITFGSGLLAFILAATLSVRIKRERLVGALGLTFLTPLSDREILCGYIGGRLLGVALLLVGPVLALPLFFVGSDPAVVGFVLLNVVLAGSCMVVTAVLQSFADGLPPYPHDRQEALRYWGMEIGGKAATAVVLTAWGAGVGVGAASGLGYGWLTAIMAAGLALSVALLWAWRVEAARRLGMVRRLAIPHGPEPELAAAVQTAGFRVR